MVTRINGFRPATSCKDTAGERQGALASEKGRNYCDGKGGNLMLETYTPCQLRIPLKGRRGGSQVLDL